MKTQNGIRQKAISNFKLVIITLGTLSLFGCAPQASFKPLYEAQSPKRDLQAKMFTFQMTRELETAHKPEVIGKLLNTLVNKEEGQKDYLSQLVKSDREQFLTVTQNLMPQVTVGVQPNLNGLVIENRVNRGNRSIDSVQLYTLIDQAKHNIKTLGLEKATSTFEEALAPFQAPILNLIHSAYLSNESGDTAQLRTAIDRVISESIGSDKIQINESLKDMADKLPKDLKMFTDLRDVISILDAQFNSSPKTDVEKLIHRLSKFTNDDIKNAQRDIKDLLNQPELSPEEKTNQYSATFRQIDAGVDLASFVVGKILNKPEEAKKILTVATSVLKVAKTFADFNVGKIGVQLATGNFIGAASDILGSFLGGGPSAEQQYHQEVMEALNTIRNDISDFRKDVNDHFKEVDKKLVNISNHLDRLLTEVTQLNANVGQIKSQLDGLSTQLDTLALMMLVGFNDIIDLKLNSEYSDCLGLLSPSTQQMGDSETHIISCLDSFFQRSVVISAKETRTGMRLPMHSVEEQTRILQSTPLDLALSPLVTLTQRYADLPGTYVVLNPKDWVMGAQSYLETLRVYHNTLSKTSNSAKKARVEVIRQMITQGESFSFTLKTIGSVTVLNTLVNQYEHELYAWIKGPTIEGQNKVLLLRELVNQILQITRPEARFIDKRLLTLFGDESIQGLFTATTFGNPDKAALRARALHSISLLRDVLMEFEVQKEAIPSHTILDDTLARLNAFKN